MTSFRFPKEAVLYIVTFPRLSVQVSVHKLTAFAGETYPASQQKLIITVSKVAMLMSPRRINFKIQTFPIKMGNASLNGVTVKTIEGLVSDEIKTSEGL